MTLRTALGHYQTGVGIAELSLPDPLREDLPSHPDVRIRRMPLYLWLARLWGWPDSGAGVS